MNYNLKKDNKNIQLYDASKLEKHLIEDLSIRNVSLTTYDSNGKSKFSKMWILQAHVGDETFRIDEFKKISDAEEYKTKLEESLAGSSAAFPYRIKKNGSPAEKSETKDIGTAEKGQPTEDRKEETAGKWVPVLDIPERYQPKIKRFAKFDPQGYVKEYVKKALIVNPGGTIEHYAERIGCRTEDVQRALVEIGAV